MELNNFILIFTLIFIGYIGKKTKKFPDNSADVLNRYVLNIAFPSIVLLNISKLSAISELFYPMIIHWSCIFVHILILLILGEILKLSKSIMGTLIIVSTLGNTAFLGIPMVTSLLGKEAVVYAVIYDQLGSGIGFILYGALILPFFTQKNKNGFKSIVEHFFKNPAFLSLIIGLCIRGVEISEAINNVLQSISVTLIPVVMIAVGLQMKFRQPLSTFKALSLGLSLKMILMPSLVVFACHLMGWKNLMVDVSIIQSGMPPMVVAAAMAINAGLEKKLAAALVGYGLLFSFITLPLIKYFYL